MRLVTRKLWRAFPELDRFGDEQCASFVRAAAAGILACGLRWSAAAIAFLTGVALLPALTILEHGVVRQGWMSEPVFGPLLEKPRWMGEIVYIVALLILLLSIGGFLGMVTRDYLLRRRVRKVLRTRGRCARCTYFLGGLPVSADLEVVCPECGFVTEVDPSLGELGERREGQGPARFAPSEAVIRASDPWLNAKRLWKWSRRTAMVAAGVLLVAGALWGWREWVIGAQAKRAAAMKPGAAGLMALVQRDQLRGGPVPDGAVNAYDLLDPLLSKMAKAETTLFPQGVPTVEGVTVTLDGSYVAQRPEPEESERAVQERTASEPHATRMLAEYERVGVFDDMRAMANAGLTLPPITVPGNQPLFSATWGNQYAFLRRMARWQGARMRLAVRDDDPARFVEALDTTLGFSRVLEKEPLLISRLVSIAIEALAYGELRAALRERHDARWLDAYERALARHTGHASATLPFEGEKLVARDTVCWVFADTANTRLGKYSPSLRKTLQFGGGGVGDGYPKGRLGNLDENLAVFDAFFDGVIADASLPRSARVSSTSAALPSTDLILPSLFLPGLQKALRSQDQIDIDRAAMPLLVALERHRLQTGAYPRVLAELTPRWVASPVVDPWTGKSFGYKRVDAAGEAQNRGFILYAFGADGVDDGGTAPKNWWEALNGNGVTGVDFIINDAGR